MIRNLKALGLALVAVFAMGALTASSASAVDTFTRTGGVGTTALVTGVSHDHKWEITSSGTKFECTTSKLTGTFVSGSKEMTVDPEYSGKVGETPHSPTECTATGGEMTFDMNGCHYVLTGNTTGHDPIGTVDATIWLTCPAGKTIQITQLGTGITIHIPPQTPTTGGVTYTTLPNHPGGSAIKVTTTATGITYNCTGFACHFAGGTHGNTIDTTGTVILTGYNDTDGLPTPITEGAQVGISVSTS